MSYEKANKKKIKLSCGERALAFQKRLLHYAVVLSLSRGTGLPSSPERDCATECISAPFLNPRGR